MNAMGRLNYKVNDFGLENGDNILGLDGIRENGKLPVQSSEDRSYRNVGFFNYIYLDDYISWFSKDYLKAVKEAFKCGVSAIHNKFWFIRSKDKNKVFVKSFAKKKFIACWQR